MRDESRRESAEGRKERNEEQRDFQRIMATLTASVAGRSRPQKRKRRLPVESSNVTSSDDGASDSDN